MRFLVFCLLLALICCCQSLAAEEPADAARSGESTPEINIQRIEMMTEVAGKYELTLDSGEPLQVIPDPLLKWSNPILRTHAGSVFLWTYQSRPQAVVGMFTSYGDVDHEWQTICETGLTAKFDGKTLWNPRTGIQWNAIDGNSEIAPSAALRMVQMRAIARKFSVEIGSAKKSTPLRMLPQPLYSYESPAADVLTGGVFGFVNATDPELLLCLEARTIGSKQQWYYTVARMTSTRITVKYQDNVVTTIDPWDWKKDPEKPFIAFRRLWDGSEFISKRNR